MNKTFHIYFHSILFEKFKELGFFPTKTLHRGTKLDDIFYWNDQDEIYQICRVLFEVRLPFVLIENDYQYFYRFGKKSDVFVSYLINTNMENKELSEEETENLNYYKVMERI